MIDVSSQGRAQRVRKWADVGRRSAMWLLSGAGLVAVLVWPATGAACSCLSTPWEKQFADSAQVFLGEVAQVQGPDGQSCDEVSICMSRCPAEAPCKVTISMRVLKVFKGAAANTVEVITSDPRNECGVYFEVGREYLVLGEGFDPALLTTVCHGTALSSVVGAAERVQEARHPAKDAAKVSSGSHCSCRAAGAPAEGALPLLALTVLALPLRLRRANRALRRSCAGWRKPDAI